MKKNLSANCPACRNTTTQAALFEREIRANFPGPQNKGLRAAIRKCETAYSVRSLSSTIGFTVRGKLGLESCAKALDEGN